MLTHPEQLDLTPDIDADLNALLAQERGWGEVSAGLTRILLGWGVLVVGIGLGIGLLILSAFLAKPAMYWALFGGMAALGICGTFSWWTVLSGLLRCLLHSPERCGVRWCIFVCMLCLAIGPVLNIASNFICSTEKPDFDKGVDGLKKFKLDATGRFIQAMCMVGTVGYNIAFILFLRAIGCCFRSLPVVRMAELYLLLYLGLLAIVAYLVFFQLSWLLHYPQLIVGLGGFGFLLFAMYIALLLVARACIGANLGKVRTTMGQAVFATA